MTMTQLTAAFCALINGGDYYKPHVVRQIWDENGNLIIVVKITKAEITANTKTLTLTWKDSEDNEISTTTGITFDLTNVTWASSNGG